MLCVCCLIQKDQGRDLVLFTVAYQKLYHELTRLEFVGHKKKLFICQECRTLLKNFSEFYMLCKKSYEQLNSTHNEQPSNETIKRATRKTRKIRKQPENEEETNEFNGCSTLGEVNDDDSDGDNLPIAVLQQKLQNNNEALVESPKDEFVKERQVIVELEVSPPKPEPKYLCECGMKFKTSQRLQVHSYTHSGIKNWKCNECEKVFATRFRLKAHSRIHTGERPFVCDVCSLCFAQGNALKCHKRVHTKERPFVCKICSKSFSQNTTLKTHMSALHLGKTVECDEPGCDKKFTRRSYLLIHKRDHMGERKYACDRCPNQYKQKSHLDRHIEASHLGIRHKCDFPGCSSEFSKSWSLKMHKFIHTPEPSQLPYQCLLCGLGFQRRDKLMKHRAKAHPEDGDGVKGETYETQVEVKEERNDGKTNYLVLASTPEIYTIQNSDGSFTEVQTLQVIEESGNQ